jgi:AcrR family transcriptional regulator
MSNNIDKFAKRAYSSERRSQHAELTRQAVMLAARELFSQHGIDAVTIAHIASQAEVATSTVYALFKSKQGILRELMKTALFGSAFQSAQAVLEGITDPLQRLRLTAQIARAIYESESQELGLLRGMSSFSPDLKQLEEEFEAMRLQMQEPRVRHLQEAGLIKPSLSLKEAQHILWMYTSRDIYRMLVQRCGWSSEHYQQWLSDTLVQALVAQSASNRLQSSRQTLPP